MGKKIIIGSILFLTVLAGITTYLFFNAEDIANTIIRNDIVKKYNESENSHYLISIDDINLNIISGSIKLLDIKLIPKDSLVILKRDSDGKTLENTFFHLHIHEISLTGFDILKAFNERVISAQSFLVSEPRMAIYHYSDLPVVEEIQQDTVDFRGLFINHYDSFNLGEFSFDDISITYHTIDSLNDTTELLTVNNLSYGMYGVIVTKETLYSPEYVQVDRYLLQSKNIDIQLQDKSYISIGSILYDSDTRNLHIQMVDFNPCKNPKQFFAQQKYRKGWIDFKLDECVISNINFMEWVTNEKMYADSIFIDNLELDLHTNLTLPHPPNVVKPMLGDLIKALPIPVHIANLLIINTSIKVDLLGRLTPIHGKLDFTQMNIQAQNLTNIPEEIDENSMLDIHVKTKINGTGTINSRIKVHLDSPTSLTQFSVNAKNLDLKKFNSVLKPIIRVSVNDGQIKSMKIRSTLSSNGAIGTMDAHYKDLKIQLESKNQGQKPGFFNNMASGLANGILKTENIPGTPYYHQSKFKISKMPYQNFFTLLWMITFHGLEDSILGSNTKDERNQRKKEKQAQPKKKLFNFK